MYIYIYICIYVYVYSYIHTYLYTYIPVRLMCECQARTELHFVLQLCAIEHLCCSELQWVAVSCSELQWVAVALTAIESLLGMIKQVLNHCCSEMQWVAVSCSELQCVTVSCSVLQHVNDSGCELKLCDVVCCSMLHLSFEVRGIIENRWLCIMHGMGWLRLVGLIKL